MSDIDNKKDVKYALYVTSKMDEDINQMADLMGVSKHEFIRMAIAQAMLGYKTSLQMVRENLIPELKKD